MSTYQDCSRSIVSKWIVILLKWSVPVTNCLSKYPNRSHPDYLYYSDIFSFERLPMEQIEIHQMHAFKQLIQIISTINQNNLSSLDFYNFYLHFYLRHFSNKKKNIHSNKTSSYIATLNGPSSDKSITVVSNEDYTKHMMALPLAV